MMLGGERECVCVRPSAFLFGESRHRQRARAERPADLAASVPARFWGGLVSVAC